ncbi:MerR family transcriptional regulator [Methylothermus subterraneus]
MTELAVRKGLYPIREVAERTGVNPVTLRAWERRYGLLKPERTPKGHRLYSEQDIELIRKVVEMLEAGVPISQVRGALAHSESAHLDGAPGHEAVERQAQDLADAALSMQPGVLDSVYQASLQAYPTLLLIRQVVRPALERLHRLQGREPLAAHARAVLCAYLVSQIGHRLWQQSLRNRGPRILLGVLGEGDALEALLLGLYLVDRGFRLLWLPEAAPLRYLDDTALASRSAAILIYVGATPSQRLLAQELPVLVANATVPVFAAGAAVAQQAGAFRAAGVEPLPLDEEALVLQLQERLRP